MIGQSVPRDRERRRERVCVLIRLSDKFLDNSMVLRSHTYFHVLNIVLTSLRNDCLLSDPDWSPLCICVASCSSMICCESWRSGMWELETMCGSLLHCFTLCILAASTNFST